VVVGNRRKIVPRFVIVKGRREIGEALEHAEGMRVAGGDVLRTSESVDNADGVQRLVEDLVHLGKIRRALLRILDQQSNL
jgi:hypothetical protein